MPHLCLLLAFYCVAARQRTLGCLASALGILAYLRVAQQYHLYWLAPTTLLCFSHLYASIKLAELIVILLTHEEHQYDPQKPGKRDTNTIWSRIRWAVRMAPNLRCIGVNCGKRERFITKPMKSAILVPTALRLGALDLLTSFVHHMTLYNNHLLFIERPLWQQVLLTSAMALSLVLVFQGTYGLLQFIGIYLLKMEASQWPPMLGRPWAATSLRQFWSKEWHSVFRRIFTFFSDVLIVPISSFLNFSKKTQTSLHVLGVFLMSALLHDFGLYLALGEHSFRTFLFFLIQGPAVLLEEAVGFSKSPVIGAIWTIAFLVVTGGPFGLIGALVDHGQREHSFLTDGFFKEFSITTKIINMLSGTDY